MLKRLICIAAALLLSGCVSMTSVTISDMVSKAGTPVTVEKSAVGIMSLTVPSASGLEAAALKELRDKGAVKNVTTRLQMRNWVFVQVYGVVATGEK
ncbi:MAG: hypothetical protein HQK54_08285 [Oligoflexales bacterium]|nr:hypothetical protein [Oligoflexales bacterium]